MFADVAGSHCLPETLKKCQPKRSYFGLTPDGLPCQKVSYRFQGKYLLCGTRTRDAPLAVSSFMFSCSNSFKWGSLHEWRFSISKCVQKLKDNPVCPELWPGLQGQLNTSLGFVTSLPLKKTRSSIGTDRGSGSTRPMLYPPPPLGLSHTPPPPVKYQVKDVTPPPSLGNVTPNGCCHIPHILVTPMDFITPL